MDFCALLVQAPEAIKRPYRHQKQVQTTCLRERRKRSARDSRAKDKKNFPACAHSITRSARSGATILTR